MDICIALLNMCMTASIFFVIYLAVKSLTAKYSTANLNYIILRINTLLFFIPISKFAEKFSHLSCKSESPSPAIIIPSKPITVSEIPAAVHYESTYNESPVHADSDFPIFKILALVWIIGAAISLSWQIFCILKFSKEHSDMRKIKNKKIMTILSECRAELKIKRNIPIFQSKNICSPMIAGLIQPKIILPSKRIPCKYLKYVFTHELIHLKRKDLLWKMLLAIAASVFWFDPIIYIMKIEFDKQLEYSCDEIIADKSEHKERKKYILAILESIDCNAERPIATGICFSTPKQKLERRFANMMNFKPMNKRRKILSAVLLAAVLSVSAYAGSNFLASSENVPVSAETPVKNIIYEPNIMGTTEYSYDEVKAWYENFMIHSDKMIADGAWDKEFAWKMQKKYKSIISSLEQNQGFFLQKASDGLVFYENENLTFRLPENIFELDPNSLYNSYCLLMIGSADDANNFAVSISFVDYEYQFNSKGQTYGTMPTDNTVMTDMPDLISAVGDNGISGYIYKEDLLEEPMPMTLEEVEKMQAEQGENTPVVINIYDCEGETVLDTFTMQHDGIYYD